MKPKIILYLCLFAFSLVGCGSKNTQNKNTYSPTISIGENGNWFIDGVDTNISSKGEQGLDGKNGKSAFEIYCDAHPEYTGTEEEWINDVVNSTFTTYENPQGLDFYLQDDNSYAVGQGTSIRLSEIIIPDKYNGRSVTSIINKGFNGSKAKKIVLPSTLQKIESQAFYQCSSLTSIVIPECTTTIEECAFEQCSSLTSVTLGAGLQSIENSAFYGCEKLYEVVNKSPLDIAVGATNNGGIGYYAKQVISDESFSKLNEDNNGLITYIDEDETYLLCYSGTKSNIEIPKGVTQIIDCAFSNNSIIESVIIPESTILLGESCFANCYYLKSITIPDSVVSIPSAAFFHSGLVSVVIGDGVTIIDDCAFKSCSSLKSVIIGGSVTEIGSSAFEYCGSLRSIIIPDSVTSLGSCAFNDCYNLSFVTIGNSVTEIGSTIFWGCGSLFSIVLGNGVSSIFPSAFDSCNRLWEVINKSSLPITAGSSDYGKIAFYAKQVVSDESLSKVHKDEQGFITYDDDEIYLLGYLGEQKDIVLPNNITFIAQFAFRRNAPNTVIIGENVTTIDSNAFCIYIKGIYIPKNILTIRSNAFVYNGAMSLHIYCELESKPDGWASDWYCGVVRVVWGCGLEQFINIR